MGWSNLALARDMLQAAVMSAINLQVPQNARNVWNV